MTITVMANLKSCVESISFAASSVMLSVVSNNGRFSRGCSLIVGSEDCRDPTYS